MYRRWPRSSAPGRSRALAATEARAQHGRRTRHDRRAGREQQLRFGPFGGRDPPIDAPGAAARAGHAPLPPRGRAGPRRWVAEALRCGGAEPYTGSKLYAAFRRAGLPPPVMRLEAIIGGPDDPSGAVEDLLETIFPVSMVPTLEHHGVATSAEIDAGTLVTRMRAEIAALG